MNIFLRKTPSHVELVFPEEQKMSPIWVDFMRNDLVLRGQNRHSKKELLLRAVGVKKNVALTVIDATAGWGRDGFLLANAGCYVMLIERSPWMAALLQDGLERFWKIQDKITADCFNLIQADAINYLNTLSENYPEVIYLDPMYPVRTKSALVKKEMRVLREIVGSDQDSGLLFLIALKKAKQRVVVKRDIRSDFLEGKKPSYQYLGKDTRFDVYLLT